MRILRRSVVAGLAVGASGLSLVTCSGSVIDPTTGTEIVVTGAISGTVSSPAGPLDRVGMWLLSALDNSLVAEAETNSAGFYRFEELTAGDFLVTFDPLEFERFNDSGFLFLDFEEEISLAEGENRVADFFSHPFGSACDHSDLRNHEVLSFGELFKARVRYPICAYSSARLDPDPTRGSNDILGSVEKSGDHREFDKVGAPPPIVFDDSVIADLMEGCNEADTFCLSAGPLVPDDQYRVFYATLVEPVPELGPDDNFQISLVLDDGDASNSYTPPDFSPFDPWRGGDYILLADLTPSSFVGWIGSALLWSPAESIFEAFGGSWMMFLNGNLIFFVVTDQGDARVRFSITWHTGDFGFSGPWLGDLQPEVPCFIDTPLEPESVLDNVPSCLVISSPPPR